MNESPWTWADQISSYRFWGIFLFFIFILLPNVFLNFSYPIFTEQLNLSASQIGTALSIKSIAGFGAVALSIPPIIAGGRGTVVPGSVVQYLLYHPVILPVSR